MKAGDLNRRVTIQARIAGADAAGQPLDAWGDVATVWANVRGETGMGTIRNSGDIPTPIKKYSFRIRFRDGLGEGMRVIYSGQAYDVQAVRMDFAGREWTDLVCEIAGDVGTDAPGSISGGNAAGTGLGSISGGGA